MPDFQIPLTDQKRSRRFTRMRWGVSAAAALLAVAIAAYFLPSGPSVARDTLVIATVQDGTFDVRVHAPGTLQPHDKRLVTTAVQGSVAAVLVQPGDTVQPGSVLVQLDNPHLQSAVVSAQSDLADAKATLAATIATLEDTKLTLQADLSNQQAAARKADLQVQAERGLEAEHVIAELDYKKAVMDAATARQQVELTRARLVAFSQGQTAQLAAQQARVQAFVAALDEAKQNLANLNVTAGEPGVVQTVAVSPGQTLDVGGAVAQVASLTGLKAVLNVDPSDAGKIADGQTATIQLNDAAQSVITGLVLRVSPSVQNGSVAVDIKLPADLPAGTRPDLAVLGDIAVTSLLHTLSVTTPVGVTAGSSATIYKLIDNGRRTVQVPVTFGIASTNAIQIVSGLQSGDQIVVSDTSTFGGKQMVRVQ
jgi:multidrug efflux pump subunit AcrA (membrane-fusion protein)